MIFYTGTDSWVYILFGLLWVAFAIYKGSNKDSTAKVAGEKPSSSSSSGFENIIDSFIAEEDTAEVFPGNREVEVVEKPIVVPGEPMVEPKMAAVFEEFPPSTTLGEMSAETSTRAKIRRINLKKAVIYSEILRRPYD